MAHNVNSMAYVGEVPWHGLGTYLGDSLVTGPEMMKAAGLDWTVAKRPLVAVTPDGYATARGHFAMVREDTGTVLGVVGKRYTPVQNTEAFAVPDVLQRSGAIRYETAGALGDGETVWSLARVPGDFVVQPAVVSKAREADAVQRWLLFSNVHDGSAVLRMGLVTVRVVCQNTLGAALTGIAEEVRIRHTRGAAEAVTLAHDALAQALLGFDAYRQVMQSLAVDPMDRAAFRGFAEELLGEVRGSIDAADESMAKARARRAKLIGELEERFVAGVGNHGETRWDALNAITEWVDHQKRRGKDAAARTLQRFESTQFGDGARIKRRALRLLVRS